MADQKDRRKLRAELVELFRQSIAERYEFENLEGRFEMERFDEASTVQVKDFFLEYIYPSLDERMEIEQSMERIGTYLKDPSKLKLLVGNMTKAIFKFGRMLPSAIQAAYSSFDTFTQALKIENALVDAALEAEFETPLTTENFDHCLKNIPQKDISQFIERVIGLFDAIVNEKLIRKTLDIFDDLAGKMEAHPEEFPVEDLKAMEFAKSVLQKGYEIFSIKDKSENDALVELIKNNEEWYIDKIYA